MASSEQISELADLIHSTEQRADLTRKRRDKLEVWDDPYKAFRAHQNWWGVYCQLEGLKVAWQIVTGDEWVPAA